MGFNELTDAELERLAILSEEMGEAQQAIGKIIRHGYASSSPIGENDDDNRCQLEKECGDILAALSMMFGALDLNSETVHARRTKKLRSIQQWLHHQSAPAEKDEGGKA